MDYDNQVLNVVIKKIYKKKTYRIIYLKNLLYSFFRVVKLIKQTKFVYLNSFFDFKWSFFPLILSVFFNKIIILSPRGELSSSVIEKKKN